MHLSPPQWLWLLSVLRWWFYCCCLLLLSLWDSVIVLRFVVPYFVSSLDWEERAGCFTLFVLLVSCDCCLALPLGAVGLSAVFNCGISSSYSLTILAAYNAEIH